MPHPGSSDDHNYNPPMLARLMVRFVLAAAVLAVPSVASARTVHCGNVAASDIHRVVGHRVSCSTAKAVARAEMHALLTPGSGARHNITVDGKRWHYTWRDVNTSAGTQIEYYKARAGRQTVTFQTHGSN
jgi:hypothetical protein